jgi:cell wall-associated NlpC family hydrolase
MSNPSTRERATMMRLRYATTLVFVALAVPALPCSAQFVLADSSLPTVPPPVAVPVVPALDVKPVVITPFVAFSRSARSLRDSLVALARAQVGRRYVFGGESPEGGFDCSGLVRYLLATFDTRIPRTAAQQARVGAAVARDATRLRPGDLLTFGAGRRTSHIGIYVGDGRFVHASSAAGRVIESRLDRRPSRLIKPWRGVRRVLSATDSTAADSAVTSRQAGG